MIPSESVSAALLANKRKYGLRYLAERYPLDEAADYYVCPACGGKQHLLLTAIRA